MPRRTILAVSAAALLATATVVAFAENNPSNLEKLGQFKTTGASPNIPTVPQGGAKAAALKKNLEKIKLPHGFHIGLYAIVPDARHMAVGPQGIVTFVGTRKAQVYAVTDRSKSGVAEEVKPFASTIDLVIPNGPCFSKDGFLFIVEQNRVLMFPAAEFFYESPDVVAVPIVPQGELIPKEDESYNHTARTCRVGPDNKLYITLGQPFNVPPPEKLDDFKKLGIGGIIRMDRDGKNREVYASGSAIPSVRTSIRKTRRCGSPTIRSTAWATTFRRANSTAPPRPDRISASRSMAAATFAPRSTRTKHRRRTSCSRKSRWLRTPPISA